MNTHPTRFHKLSGALPALAVTLLCAQALAQKPVRAPLPQMPDVKTEAPIVVKTPAAPLPARALEEIAAPARSAPPGTRFNPLEGRVAWSDGEQGTHVASTRWKAQFTREGTTYVPFFGSSAARNVPLRFTTQSITVSGAPLASLGSDVRRAGNRVTIERGVVDESWNVSAEHAEQTYTIDAPLGAGDVTVRVGFEGEYVAEKDADGILFKNESGNVRYGRATAIDAAGRKIDVQEVLVDGAIELVVPASFLAEAAYPVVIDPVLTTYPIDNTTAESFQVDIAFEGSSHVYAYAWEVAFSSTDHDIYVVCGDDSTLIAAPLFTIDNTSVNWAHPSIASNRLAGNLLVVAQVGIAGAREIKGRRVVPNTAAAEAAFTIADTVGGEKINPVVGGDPGTTGPTYYCVAFERSWTTADHDIFARLVDGLEAGSNVHPLLFVENSSSTLDQLPAISKSNGKFPFITQDWTIVWERRFDTDDHDIFGRQIFWDGTPMQPTFVIDTSSNDDRSPVVSSIADGHDFERPYVVAWTRRMSPTDRDIIAAACRFDQVDDIMNVSSGLGNQTNDDATPSIDCDGHLFGLAWAKLAGVGDYDIWMNWITVADGAIGRVGNTETIAVLSSVETNPAVVAKHSGGASTNRFAVAFQRWNGTNTDLYATRVDAPTGVPTTSYCAGTNATCPCGNGGSGTTGCASSTNPGGAGIAASGGALVSSDTFALFAIGLPQTASCLFFQGTTPLNFPNGTAFGDGVRCVGGSVTRLGLKTAVGGIASYPDVGDVKVATKGHILPMGGARYYQAWYRNAANFCTTSTFNLTNAVKATWLP